LGAASRATTKAVLPMNMQMIQDIRSLIHRFEGKGTEKIFSEIILSLGIGCDIFPGNEAQKTCRGEPSIISRNASPPLYF
jgi:hypothetical protein